MEIKTRIEPGDIFRLKISTFYNKLPHDKDVMFAGGERVHSADTGLAKFTIRFYIIEDEEVMNLHIYTSNYDKWARDFLERFCSLRSCNDD